MALNHIVVIDGNDVSDWVDSIRADENINHNEPDKIDITLININDMFTGLFETQKTLSVRIENDRRWCEGNSLVAFNLTEGVVQKVSYSPGQVKIEASCKVGPLSEFIEEEVDIKQRKISEVVAYLLDMFNAGEGDYRPLKYQIDIADEADEAFDFQWNNIKANAVSYQTALTFLAGRAGCIWYMAESDDGGESTLYFTDPKMLRGRYDIDPWMQNPDETFSVLGHKNKVRVIGSGVNPPSSEYAPHETHQRLYADVENPASIAKHGEIRSPTFVQPNLTTQDLVEQRADMLIRYYKVAENVARPRLIGWTPPILSYAHWYAGVKNSAHCGGAKDLGDRRIPVEGLVIRRVIEYSMRGLEVELEVSTEATAGGIWDPNIEMVWVATSPAAPLPTDDEEYDAQQQFFDDHAPLYNAFEEGAFDDGVADIAGWEAENGVKVSMIPITGIDEPMLIFVEDTPGPGYGKQIPTNSPRYLALRDSLMELLGAEK
jgi:hypothetical protein